MYVYAYIYRYLYAYGYIYVYVCVCIRLFNLDLVSPLTCPFFPISSTHIVFWFPLFILIATGGLLGSYTGNLIESLDLHMPCKLASGETGK